MPFLFRVSNAHVLPWEFPQKLQCSEITLLFNLTCEFSVGGAVAWTWGSDPAGETNMSFIGRHGRTYTQGVPL